jgi:hypothetical protein
VKPVGAEDHDVLALELADADRVRALAARRFLACRSLGPSPLTRFRVDRKGEGMTTRSAARSLELVKTDGSGGTMVLFTTIVST